ncbi:MAG TPA: efflux RND transporter periplasmic adaptor subunit [Bacteroidales bacterium]|nr:efflux RND transporter periplasmic adaptor subunit [Bacteroidales bacterium]
MKRTVIITGIVFVVAIIVLIIFNKATSRKDIANLYTESKRGQFDIIVNTTGELQAENSTDIRGPEFTRARNVRVMDIKIQDMVPEGTEVSEGDFIASLDRTSFDNTLKDEFERLTTYQTNLEMKILDTAVTLSNLRDNIKNLRFTVEEAEITLQQSKYEPPTTIRQAEIALDKANRSLDQSIRSYSLKVEQAKSEMRNQKNQLTEQQQRVNDLQDLLANFRITAPSPGMVIYKRDRMGNKRKIGSSINPWDNVVATLPDMSSMLSKTYVNEIDVSKVKPNQKVEIAVDAFPERSYTGSVISVANIGEQLPNADAKVFEVLIKVDGSDPILRPSMTTGNKIITKTINDVIYIPLESVQAGIDSIPFVYMKNGNKQIVVLGESNENNVIIEQGLAEGTQTFLSTPPDPQKFKLTGEDLIAVIKEKERAKKDEENRLREEAIRAREHNQRMTSFGSGQAPSPEMIQRMGGGQAGGQRDTAAMRRMRMTGTQTGSATRDTSVRRSNVVRQVEADK